MRKAPDESIWIGTMRVVLCFPNAKSKKDKRKVISKLRDRFRSRYNLSVAEVGHLESNRFGVFVAAMIGNDAKKIQSYLDTRANELPMLIDARIDWIDISINKPQLKDLQL